MHSGRPLAACWLGKLVNAEQSVILSAPPLFLCPSLSLKPFTTTSLSKTYRVRHHPLSVSGKRKFFYTTTRTNSTNTEASLLEPTPACSLSGTKLPTHCHGCGALSQTRFPHDAGYFGMERRTVRQYIGILDQVKLLREEDRTVEDALLSLGPEQLDRTGIELSSLTGNLNRRASLSSNGSSHRPPLCDRCHDLVHHRHGKSIAHPTIDAVRDTIEETSFKYNHIYHILDAADFPMSLLPRINQLLNMMPLRTKNRRSQPGKFVQGRRIEMSFVVTRSDLLAPRKEQVDSLLPYLKDVLRDALGRSGRNVRLGNISCVSAKRSWWIKELREEIWDRGGGSWMVGKVNVGKSQLFEGVFPKGRMDWVPPKHQITISMTGGTSSPTSVDRGTLDYCSPILDPERVVQATEELQPLNEFSLLPPARRETNYPEMPVVSSLPGTTASPIRIPFGNGKGELIDLPGLSRGDLEHYVEDKHRSSLVMKSRIVPEQCVLKPGQSLLLGGFIRITPRTPDLIFLAYNFTTFEKHRTTTSKAIAIQEQTDEAPKVENISLPGTGAKIKHAGTFTLCHDVTKKRAGPITRRDAAHIPVERLPYRVLALDLLIEGCGWVEIVAQVRTKNFSASSGPPPSSAYNGALDWWNPSKHQKKEPGESSAEPSWPLVDVFSPDGQFIGSRRPMNGWLLNKPRSACGKSRPRRSMKGAKKKARLAKRAAESQAANRYSGCS